MKYTYTFTLPGLPKTANARPHFMAKAREARMWRSAVALVVGRFKPEKPLKRAKLTYLRASSSPIDFDNLAGSFKNVQDGLIDAGVLVDDKVKNIGHPTYLWEKAPAGKGFIRVTIEEVMEDQNEEASPGVDPSPSPGKKGRHPRHRARKPDLDQDV